MWCFLAKIFSVRVRGAWYFQLLNLIKINIVQLPSARIAQINKLKFCSELVFRNGDILFSDESGPLDFLYETYISSLK